MSSLGTEPVAVRRIRVTTGEIVPWVERYPRRRDDRGRVLLEVPLPLVPPVLLVPDQPRIAWGRSTLRCTWAALPLQDQHLFPGLVFGNRVTLAGLDLSRSWGYLPRSWSYPWAGDEGWFPPNYRGRPTYDTGRRLRNGLRRLYQALALRERRLWSVGQQYRHVAQLMVEL